MKKKLIKVAVATAAVYGVAHGGHQLYSDVFELGTPTRAQQFANLQARIDKLKLDIAAIEIKADVDRRNLAVAQEWEKVREDDLALSKSDLAKTAKELEQKLSDIGQLQQANSKLDAENQTNLTEIAALEAKITDTNAQLEMTIAQKAEALKLAESEAEKSALMAQKIAGLQDELNQFAINIAQLDEKFKSSLVTVSELSDQLTNKEIALTDKTDEAAQLLREVNEGNQDLLNARKNIAALEEELSQSRMELSNVQRKNRDQVAQARKLKTQLTDKELAHSEQTKIAQAEIEGLQGELNRTQSQLADTELALDQQKKQTLAAEITLTSVTNNLSDVQLQIAKLETDVKKYKLATEQARASYQKSLETISLLEEKLVRIEQPSIATLNPPQ